MREWNPFILYGFAVLSGLTRVDLLIIIPAKGNISRRQTNSALQNLRECLSPHFVALAFGKTGGGRIIIQGKDFLVSIQPGQWLSNKIRRGRTELGTFIP